MNTSLATVIFYIRNFVSIVFTVLILISDLITSAVNLNIVVGAVMAFGLKGTIPAFLNPEQMFSGVVALSHALENNWLKLNLVITFPVVDW